MVGDSSTLPKPKMSPNSAKCPLGGNCPPETDHCTYIPRKENTTGLSEAHGGALCMSSQRREE